MKKSVFIQRKLLEAGFKYLRLCDTESTSPEIKHYTLEENIDADEEKTWYEDSNINYDFTEDDLPKVREVVNKLDKEVGHYLKNFKLDIDNCEGISYEVDFADKRVGKKKQEKMARLCLGLQIIKSIELKGSCSFNVET